MIEYPIDIEAFEPEEGYDPFLSHVIRHKLRKKKNRRKLRRLIHNHPKNRILRSLGIGRRRRRSHPTRPMPSRYRRPDSRPLRNTMRRRPRVIPRPVPFGNPIQRDVERDKETSNIQKDIPKWNSKEVRFGDPSKRNQSRVRTLNPEGKGTQGSKDTVLPYKRKYGKSNPSPMPEKTEEKTINPIKDEMAVTDQALKNPKRGTQEEKETDQIPVAGNPTRKTKKIIGIAVVGLLVTGIIVYTVKSKMNADGHTR